MLISLHQVIQSTLFLAHRGLLAVEVGALPSSSDSLKQNVSCSTSLPFYRSCFEVAQLTLTLHNQRYNFFCIYRPPPNKKNAFTDTIFYIYIFLKSIPRIFLEYCDTLSGKVLIMGDFNIHFETLNDHNPRKMHIRNIQPQSVCH